MTLLEHTALTGLYWYKHFTCPLTLDWLLQFPGINFQISSLKYKQIVAETDYLKTSVCSVLRFYVYVYVYVFFILVWCSVYKYSLIKAK